MGAPVVAMGEIDWKLKEPDRWTDPEGRDWVYNPEDADFQSLFAAGHAQIVAGLWKQAGQRPE